MKSNQLSLGDMPFEIHLLIFSFLDYPSAMALKKTSRGYYENLSITQRFEPQIANAYLTCTLCCRVLLRSSFGNKQTRKKRRRGGPDAHKRFCLECGLSHRKYRIGVRVAWGRLFWIFCRRCSCFTITFNDRFCEDCTSWTPEWSVASTPVLDSGPFNDELFYSELVARFRKHFPTDLRWL